MKTLRPDDRIYYFREPVHLSVSLDTNQAKGDSHDTAQCTLYNLYPLRCVLRHYNPHHETAAHLTF